MSERVRYRRHMTLVSSPAQPADYDEYTTKVVESLQAWELSLRPIVDYFIGRGDARAAGAVEAAGLGMLAAAGIVQRTCAPRAPIVGDVG